MATGGGGGGGGGPGGGRPVDDDAHGGDGRFVGVRLFPEGIGFRGVDLAADEELPAPMRPRAAWEYAWTSAGSSSSFDPMSHYVSDSGLHSEMWELFVQFDGAKFVQKSMPRSDIRYLNLLALMEKEGYGICDSMYYVKDEGEGLNGLDLVDSNCKVEEMIRKYENSKKLVLTVMREKRRNQAIVLSPLKRKNAETMQAKSCPIQIDLDPQKDEPVTYQMQTQESVYCKNLHTLADDDDMPEQEDGQSGEESDTCYEDGQCDPVYVEEMRKIEEEWLKKTIAEMKNKKDDPLTHCEGETDVEDIFFTEEDIEQMQVQKLVKKKVKNQGPTLRSHSQVEKQVLPDWVPSDDEEDLGFLNEDDDDGFEALPFVQPKGRKSRAKKYKPRVWYDENRESPEQQFMLKLCFKDVYQFREALARLHIVQVRNFHYHRNCKDRIIVDCKEREKFGCQFYMSASQIKHEQTFCIKKLHLEHTCPTSYSSTRVNSKWLSSVYVDKFRSDPNTCITSLQDKAKKDFGVDVPKRMAYRAKSKARDRVLGHHKKQYHRIRDYLQTVIDKNPGSRCIVTTATGPTEEEIEAMQQGQNVDISYEPRFHGLFWYF